MKKKVEKIEYPSYFAIIPAEVRYCNRIPPAARLLFGEIMCLANKSGYCWASNEYLGNLYDVNPTTISEWVSLLNKEGFINASTKGKTRKITILSTLRKKVDNSSEKPESNASEKVEHNNTSINNINIINNINESNEDVVSNTPFNSKEELKKLISYKQQWLRVIGVFAIKKGLTFSSKKEINQLTARFSRVAKRLADFDEKKVIRAFDYCSTLKDNSGKQINWSLETAEKQLLTNPNI